MATIEYGRLPKLQQAHLHDEDSRHDENTRDNVPETHEMPFEGDGQRKELK